MIHWTSKSQYVDIETGEIISKQLAERDYDIVSTTREPETIDSYTMCMIYTKLCTKKRQLSLWNQNL